MAPIALLPTARARTAAPDLNPRNRDTCGIFDVAGRFGQAHRSLPWLRRYIDGLVTAAGFPAPYPLVRGGALAAGVHADSRWASVAVDTWFDGQLPPDARAAIGVAERYAIDSRLAGRAAAMFGKDAA